MLWNLSICSKIFSYLGHDYNVGNHDDKNTEDKVMTSRNEIQDINLLKEIEDGSALLYL